VIFADHQNKPDVAVSVASRWFDEEGVDVIAEIGSTTVAFALLDVVKQKNKVMLLGATGSANFTGEDCAPDNVAHWIYDSYQLGASIGVAIPQLGQKWFLLNADYSFGKAMEAGVKGALEKYGASVAASVFHPLGTQDYSSYILQAKDLDPDVIALNNGGEDTANAVKSAREFGLDAKIVGFGLDTPAVIKSLTLPTAHDVYYVTSWLRRDDAETDAFVEEFMKRRDMVPSAFHVGDYSAVLHYLKAVDATKSSDPKTVMAKMRELPVNDVFAQGGVLRPDGRMVHDVALMQIKKPEESEHEWDLAKLVSALKGEDVFRPMSEGGCPFVN
jgi:branched-chain amino acid transport system substrate-binding protein